MKIHPAALIFAVGIALMVGCGALYARENGDSVVQFLVGIGRQLLIFLAVIGSVALIRRLAKAAHNAR